MGQSVTVAPLSCNMQNLFCQYFVTAMYQHHHVLSACQWRWKSSLFTSLACSTSQSEQKILQFWSYARLWCPKGNWCPSQQIQDKYAGFANLQNGWLVSGMKKIWTQVRMMASNWTKLFFFGNWKKKSCGFSCRMGGDGEKLKQRRWRWTERGSHRGARRWIKGFILETNNSWICSAALRVLGWGAAVDFSDV